MSSWQFYHLFFFLLFLCVEKSYWSRDRLEATVQLCGSLWYSADMGSIRKGFGRGGWGWRKHKSTGRGKQGPKKNQGRKSSIAERLSGRFEAGEKKREDREEQSLERWCDSSEERKEMRGSRDWSWKTGKHKGGLKSDEGVQYCTWRTRWEGRQRGADLACFAPVWSQSWWSHWLLKLGRSHHDVIHY